MNLGIHGLEIQSVQDRGTANIERINISVKAPVNLGRYLLGLGIVTPGGVVPCPDVMLWLGSADVLPGDWLVVNTGPGENGVFPIPDTSNKILSLFWGRATTLFHRPESVALLMEVSGFQASVPVPPPLPQIHKPFDENSLLSSTVSSKSWPGLT